MKKAGRGIERSWLTLALLAAAVGLFYLWLRRPAPALDQGFSAEDAAPPNPLQTKPNPETGPNPAQTSPDPDGGKPGQL